jgi:two-component system chemotaxis sensor kinase CheA
MDDDVPTEVLWHLSLRFGPDVLRNGMDPLSFLRYLALAGRLRVRPLPGRSRP